MRAEVRAALRSKQEQLGRWRSSVVHYVMWTGVASISVITVYKLFTGQRWVASLSAVSLVAVLALFLTLPRGAEARLSRVGWLVVICLVDIAGTAMIEVPSESSAGYYFGAILLAATSFTAPRRTVHWVLVCWGVALGVAGWETAAFGRIAQPSRVLSVALFMGVCTALVLFTRGVRRAILSELAQGERALARKAEEAAQSAAALARANAELKVATEVKSQFLANMSHEIRTPITAVLGMTALLGRDERLGAEQRHLVQVAHRAGSSLLQLLNDLLDVSKLQAGRMELRPRMVHPTTLVEDVVALFSAKAENAHLQLRMEVSSDVPDVVEIDDVRVSQVLRNLVSNALKFTEEGGVCLRLSAPREGWLEVEVKDSGVGIREEDLGRLFSFFTQVDDSNTRRAGGSGLGLAICKELTELMGGEIEVRSRLGGGSTFTCRWPAPDRAGEQVTMDLEAQGDELEGLRVLVAEDNPVNQLIVGRYLRILGLDATIVEDGEAVLEQIQSEPYDVILMDCHMPKKDGFETTRALRAQGERQRIIAISASARPQDIERSRAVGMDAYLAKPFSVEELARVLLH